MTKVVVDQSMSLDGFTTGPNPRPEEPNGDGGMVLGIFPDTQYDQSELALKPGDRLLFYTDGITEARNPEGEEYGEDRLAAAALAVSALEALAIKDAVLADVNAFTNGKFEDDATLIVVGITI